MLTTDPISGKAMMFGGYDSFTVIPVYSNTYLWTGTSWKTMHPSTQPFPRGWGIAVSDPLRHNVVLTGGQGGTIRSDNTWTWDGQNWTLLSPATQIPAFVSAGSAFDPTMQEVVVFGGSGETWSWTGADWVQLTPLDSPRPRSAMGMAYDIKSGQTVLFGGQLLNGKLMNDTWVFSSGK
jgi:hypothetical protein